MVDIVFNVFLLILVCVLSNHMGLILAIEEIIKHKIPILNCVKCSTFWSVILFLLLNSIDVIPSVAFAFISSYIAIWLELVFGIIDFYYGKVFSKIYSAEEDKTSEESSDNDNSKDSEI